MKLFLPVWASFEMQSCILGYFLSTGWNVIVVSFFHDFHFSNLDLASFGKVEMNVSASILVAMD